MKNATNPLSYGTIQTEVSEANFAGLADGPDFPKAEWTTMVYHADLNKLSAYGHEGAIDHHLIVNGLDSKDEKRVVEVLAALKIASEEDIRRALRTRRIFQSFVRPF